MKKLIIFAALTTLIGMSVITCKTNKDPLSSHNKIILTNGTLIDGTGHDPWPGAFVVIENGVITDVGTAADKADPSDAKVYNLDGSTIMPGFFNCHVHDGYNERNLLAWAREGVTTIRDLGGNPAYDLFGFRDRVNKQPSMSRLVAAGPMVTVPNGYPGIPWNSPIGYSILSPEDAREKINLLLDHGADLIKIAVESGGEFGRDIPTLSPEEARAICQVAHERGAPVSAHVLTSDDLARAIAAGVDDIAHMVIDDPPDSLLREMVSRDIYWVPTLELWHCVGGLRTNKAVANLRRFIQAGGKVALGTDYDGYACAFDPGMPMTEIDRMQKAGMSPMQIILAGTRNAAHVCNLEEKIGTIQTGKIADLLVVKGDPLSDLKVLKNVALVIHEGVVIRSELR